MINIVEIRIKSNQAEEDIVDIQNRTIKVKKQVEYIIEGLKATDGRVITLDGHCIDLGILVQQDKVEVNIRMKEETNLDLIDKLIVQRERYEQSLKEERNIELEDGDKLVELSTIVSEGVKQPHLRVDGNYMISVRTGYKIRGIQIENGDIITECGDRIVVEKLPSPDRIQVTIREISEIEDDVLQKLKVMKAKFKEIEEKDIELKKYRRKYNKEIHFGEEESKDIREEYERREEELKNLRKEVKELGLR